MKKLAVVLIGGMLFSCRGAETFTAGMLKLTLDEKGKITELADASRNVNHIYPKSSYALLGIHLFGKDNGLGPLLAPNAMKVVSRGEKETVLELAYPDGASVRVNIRHCGSYLRLEVAAATAPDGVAAVRWGPYETDLTGPIGEWLGVNRGEGFTLGLMSLGINTDGGAAFLNRDPPGSRLFLSSFDLTRPGRYANFRTRPVPGVTVAGAAVALWASAPEKELDTVEQIELAEKLPHPTLGGVWAKRSPRANASGFWINYDEKNIDQYIALAKATGIHLFSRYNCFGNWGHFDPSPVAFPHGWEGIRACSQKAADADIRTTCYTLSDFTRPFSLPEPYLTPIPDARFAQYDPAATLAANVSQTDTIIRLKADNAKLAAFFPPTVSGPDAVHYFGNPNGKKKGKPRILRIGDELIVYTAVATNQGEIVLGECLRGAYTTKPAAYQAGTSAVRLAMYDGYDAFIPGTDDLNEEIARNIAKAACSGDLRNIILDGLEVTRYAGHGEYSFNHFVKTLFDHVPNEGMSYVSSCMNHYTWHIFTTQSWGEYDIEHTVRGSQLEWRLMHQIELPRNRIPTKLGQYYPEQSTPEDIDWIMALAAGYDSGVDFMFGSVPADTSKFQQIRDWELARLGGAFDERQKMLMRQTDCIWKLGKAADGKWTANFVKRWISPTCKTVPSSSAPARALGGAAAVAPCSIDLGWTHSPCICERVCLTDDLVLRGATNTASFEVVSPFSISANGTYGFPCVLRVPASSPAVKNPKLVLRVEGRTYYLFFPTTLQPGEYLTIPHRVPVAFVYGPDHGLRRELQLMNLPSFNCAKGGKINVTLTGDFEKQQNASLLLNLRLLEPTTAAK